MPDLQTETRIPPEDSGKVQINHRFILPQDMVFVKSASNKMRLKACFLFALWKYPVAALIIHNNASKKRQTPRHSEKCCEARLFTN